MRVTYAARRKVLLAGLTRLGLAPRTAPTGAFYVFVRADRLGADSLALAYDILEKAHLGVTPGIDFGPGGEGHLRFSYANSLENIEEGLERLGRYMEAMVDRLRSAQRQYQGLFENATEGVFQTSLDGRITSANKALARMLGFASAQALVLSVEDVGSQVFYDPGDRRRMISSFTRSDAR